MEKNTNIFNQTRCMIFPVILNLWKVADDSSATFLKFKITDSFKKRVWLNIVVLYFHFFIFYQSEGWSWTDYWSPWVRGWNGIGCGRWVRVQTPPGATLTNSACMAELTVQERRGKSLGEQCSRCCWWWGWGGDPRTPIRDHSSDFNSFAGSIFKHLVILIALQADFAEIYWV